MQASFEWSAFQRLGFCNKSPQHSFPAPSTPTTSATTIVSNRLAQIVKKLSDNCKEWESQQQHGTDIIKAIIVNIPKDSSAQNADHYTASLERLCKQLHACVAIFHDVNETTKKCLEELRALWALSGQSKDVQSKSWNFEQYIKWTEETVEEFQEIYEIKKIVMGKLGFWRLEALNAQNNSPACPLNAGKSRSYSNEKGTSPYCYFYLLFQRKSPTPSRNLTWNCTGASGNSPIHIWVCDSSFWRLKGRDICHLYS